MIIQPDKTKLGVRRMLAHSPANAKKLNLPLQVLDVFFFQNTTQQLQFRLEASLKHITYIDVKSHNIITFFIPFLSKS